MKEKPPYFDMGQRIKQARESTEHNQPSMTRALGLKEPTYGNYERGRNRMPPHVMDKFVKITGYSASWLYLGKGSPKIEKKQGMGEKMQEAYQAAPEHIRKTIDDLLKLED